MPEEDIVNKLVGELNKQTEPYAAWKAAKGTIHKGTGATRAKKDYMEEAFGPRLVDRIESYAVDFYGGQSKDAVHLAHDLRGLLRDNYGQFRRALQHGKIDKANDFVADAMEGKYAAGGLEGIAERITSFEKPEERIEAGKKLAPLVKGDDYVVAANNPGQLAQVLLQQKQLAEAYKVPGGARG